MVKRLLAILLTISLLSGMLVFPVSAEVETGICGDNLTWTWDGSTYLLTISGTGPMYDYSEENPAPWADKAGLTNYIDIQEGVTRIGDYAFARTRLAEKTFVANTVAEVGSRAFSAIYYQGEITFAGEAPIFAEDALYGTTVPIYYYSNWDPLVLQNYGGTPVWTQKNLHLKQNKKLYALNEEIKIEDFSFLAEGRCDNKAYSYMPKEFELGAYDNSTYGQKYVELTVEGKKYTVEYFVTDGQSHLDLVEVRYPTYVEYNKSWHLSVVVGERRLVPDQEYTQTYVQDTSFGYAPRFTITGQGIFEGFEQTYSYAVVKRDISDTYISVAPQIFTGQPLYPAVTVIAGYQGLTEGVDYALIYENNVNVGTGTVRIVGMGNYCGSVTKEFQIELEATTVSLPGAYNGTVEELVNDNVYYSEGILTPGVFTGKINSSGRHTAYYELYRIDSETPVLVTSMLSEYNTSNYTAFTYDFTSVYDAASEIGGEVYMLVYSWVNSSNQVYSGVCVLYIPAKVPNATEMVIERVEGTSDYNKIYLDLIGTDGNVENAEWSTSNATVATVEDGEVMLKSPGTVTITAQHAGVAAAYVFVIESQDFTDSAFFKYDTVTSTAYVTYDDMPLTEGVDFLSFVSVEGNVAEVTLKGVGLFAGELVRQFDVQSGEAVGNPHFFDNSCDEVCNVCDYTRTVEHEPAESWRKDQIYHWHPCAVCGGKATEAQEHTISPENTDLCTVCGLICVPGDADGDGEVTDWDGVMLARYLAGWPVEVELAALDVDGDGEVTDWDGVVLDRYLAGWSVTIG